MNTVLFTSLPDWAQKKIKTAGKGIVQTVMNNDSLQIREGVAKFNGKLVVYSEEEMSTEEMTISFFALPHWAKLEIIKAGNSGMATIQDSTNNLTIINGKATYNGMNVVMP